MLLGQQLLAQQYFNSQDIQKELPDSFTSEYSNIIQRADDIELQKRIVDEKNRAFYMFQQLYDVQQKHWIVTK